MAEPKPISIKLHIDFQFKCPYERVSTDIISIKPSDLKIHIYDIIRYTYCGHIIHAIIENGDYDTFVFAIKALDLRLYKISEYSHHILESHDMRYLQHIVSTDSKEYPSYIIPEIMRLSTDDIFLDKYLYTHANLNQSNMRIDQSNDIRNCIQGSNYKIVSHYVENNKDKCYCSEIITNILSNNFEFVDIFLKYNVVTHTCYNTTNLRCISNVKLSNLQYLHQLYIEDRVHIWDMCLINLITRTDDPDVFVYLLTLLPMIRITVHNTSLEFEFSEYPNYIQLYKGPNYIQLYKGVEFIAAVEDYVRELRMINTELLKLIE